MPEPIEGVRELQEVARKSPAAFLIPARQRDPGATRKMLETLAFGQVEIVEDLPAVRWMAAR